MAKSWKHNVKWKKKTKEVPERNTHLYVVKEYKRNNIHFKILVTSGEERREMIDWL